MTEPSIDELAATVRAGIAEDERIAREATPGRWVAQHRGSMHRVHGGAHPLAGLESDNRLVHQDGDYPPGWPRDVVNPEADADHIARHSPPRVLADVAAKRALLDEALGWEHHEADDPWYTCMAATKEHEGFWHPDRDKPQRGFTLEQWQACSCGRDDHVRAVLECLAVPYRERP